MTSWWREEIYDTEGGDNLGNHLVDATERKNAGHAPVLCEENTPVKLRKPKFKLMDS